MNLGFAQRDQLFESSAQGKKFTLHVKEKAINIARHGTFSSIGKATVQQYSTSCMQKGPGGKHLEDLLDSSNY